MIPYINLHTHHSLTNDGVFLFNNRFGFDKIYELKKPYSIGVHPWDTLLFNETKLPDLEKLINNKNCFAIGECGLDKLSKTDFRKQKFCFETQLTLAAKHQKPVIIHCVKAFDEVVGICKPYLSKIPLIMHGFNKTDELAQQLINKGFYVSVSTPFLYKTKLTKVVLNKLFFETDDKKDLLIADVYKLASQKFNTDSELLKTQINDNFNNVFKTK